MKLSTFSWLKASTTFELTIRHFNIQWNSRVQKLQRFKYKHTSTIKERSNFNELRTLIVSVCVKKIIFHYLRYNIILNDVIKKILNNPRCSFLFLVSNTARCNGKSKIKWPIREVLRKRNHVTAFFYVVQAKFSSPRM